MSGYGDFFRRATGMEPFAYQLEVGRKLPNVLRMPTGSGKTEAVMVGWMWRTRHVKDTPRRLVYCLPRRTLVEQTAERARNIVNKLGADLPVYQMMGGNTDLGYEIRPDKPCMIVGTQDMLLSGALNRGYGRGPSWWPVSFGLLNNDCLWVLDEVQLMENGLPTSTQLDGFRELYGTFGPHQTVWMSATIIDSWLKTPDGQKISIPELPTDGLTSRLNAAKTLRRAEIREGGSYGPAEAAWILSRHRTGSPTAVIVNTVGRAQQLYMEMLKAGADNCVLVHSRFRRGDRRRLNEVVKNTKGDSDVILVCTQVLEAGIDVSVRTLVTELAPWPSIVQRSGRCNRYGNMDDAQVWWIDIGPEDGAPYEAADMDESRDILESLEGKSASPATLDKFSSKHEMYDVVLRRADLLGLFDADADLSGARTDASRFVRSSGVRMDAGVIWRRDDAESGASDAEICSAPLADVRKMPQPRIWDWKDGTWKCAGANDIRPGSVVMLDTDTGGYTAELGWHPGSTETVPEMDGHSKPDSYGSDDGSVSKRAITLADHTGHVVFTAERLVADLPLDDDAKRLVAEAALWHDTGKAHSVFQDTMKRQGCPPDGVWAKSPKRGGRHERRGFRHEAASALCYIANEPKASDLVAYLIAAHHGKVRLSLENTLLGTLGVMDMVAGLREGDILPEIELNGRTIPQTELDLSVAGLGRPAPGKRSWTDMCLGVLERVGPFKLGYLEAVIRAADGLASADEEKA